MAIASERPKNLPWLTFARFPAAMLVMVFHTWNLLASNLPPGPVTTAVGRVAGRGGLSVAFFYILSGFILTYVHSRESSIAPRRFFLSRFARIWPVYAVSLLLAFPIFLAQSLAVLANHPGLGGWARVAIRAGSALTFLQAWSPATALTWTLTSWSLSCEVFFYLSFPWIMPRIAKLATWKVAIIGLGALVPMIGRFWVYQWTHSLHMHFNPLARWPEFVAGICLALLFLRGLRLGGGAALVCAAMVLVPTQFDGPVLFSVAVEHIGIVGLLLWLASAPECPRRWSGIPEGLGKASYALFLFHPTLFRYYPNWLTGSVAGWLACIAATIGVSHLANRWIEEPARKWILAKYGSKRA